jgi:subtilisin family serine protease
MKNDCALLPFIREDLYGLNRNTEQFYGWEISKFNIQQLWKSSTGDGVRVAIIDTGCDINHDDLKNNLLQGINLVNNKKDPIDGNGHGTHVSGTIAAENNSKGMVGVAPKTKIIPIKALNDDGSGNNYDIAKGIVWAVDYGCDFIGMSLGCENEPPDIKKAIEYAIQKNVIIFCAAGNSGEKHSLLFPAGNENTISIGAIDRNLNRTDFTCTGEQLDFLCPGKDIVSCVPKNNYASMSGTSMSTPFAIGCASLLLSYRRKNNLVVPKTIQDYINIFKTNSKSLVNKKYSNQKKYEGYGILYPIL